MEQENRPELKISGAGSAGGGKYSCVKISGAGKVEGDIECSTFNTSGSSEIRGNLKSGDIKISGASHIKGSLSCDDMGVSGSLNIDGNVDAGKMKISGGVDIGGSLHGRDVDIKGGIKINGDCEAENFNSKGSFTIEGLLNSDNISVTLYGNSRAREIGGGKIEVRKFNSSVGSIAQAFIDMCSFHKGVLNVDLIEGDDIYLEGTRAKVVRGNNVVIGPDCNIELVEYKTDVTVLKDTYVEEKRKL